MRITGIVSGYACLALSLLIVAEILGRKLFNFSIQGVDEIGGYVVAITGTFGMAVAAWHRAHTRLDIVQSRLPMLGRAITNVFAYLTLAIGAAFMAYMAWQTLSETIEFKSVSSTPLQTPLWIPQTFWFLGLMLFTVTAATMALHGLVLLKNDVAKADQSLQPTTLREELETIDQQVEHKS
ncbi:MAG: TRAP transporter small permease subunit [Granulosicoccus sp.]